MLRELISVIMVARVVFDVVAEDVSAGDVLRVTTVCLKVVLLCQVALNANLVCGDFNF